jgi:hypothetical protein
MRTKFGNGSSIVFCGSNESRKLAMFSDLQKLVFTIHSNISISFSASDFSEWQLFKFAELDHQLVFTTCRKKEDLDCLVKRLAKWLPKYKIEFVNVDDIVDSNNWAKKFSYPYYLFEPEVEEILSMDENFISMLSMNEDELGRIASLFIRGIDFSNQIGYKEKILDYISGCRQQLGEFLLKDVADIVIGFF